MFFFSLFRRESLLKIVCRLHPHASFPATQCCELQLEEISTWRSTAASVENAVNEKTSKVEELLEKVSHLESVNENMRVEFLQKVIGALIAILSHL